MEKAELKKLLLEGTEQLLVELGKILDENGDLYNDLIILWDKYKVVERKIQIGLISLEEFILLKNQVNDGLLKLIDKIENPNKISAETEKREVAVEEAIEWLTNALMEFRTEYEKEESPYERPVKRYHHVDNININQKGEFSLIIYEASIEYRGYEEDYYNEINKTLEGRFQDISSISIEKDDYSDNVHWLKCRAVNYQKVFFQKRAKIEK